MLDRDPDERAPDVPDERRHEERSGPLERHAADSDPVDRHRFSIEPGAPDRRATRARNFGRGVPLHALRLFGTAVDRDDDVLVRIEVERQVLGQVHRVGRIEPGPPKTTAL